MQEKRAGFTLIEVMIATVIISIVIMALLKIFSNNTNTFLKLQKNIAISFKTTLLFSDRNRELGFENDEVSLDQLVRDVRVDDRVRRELKNIKAKITYSVIDTLDQSDFEDQAEELNDENGEENQVVEGASSVNLEIGRTGMKIEDTQSAFIRMRIAR